uniref:potassium/proton antiporter n=1 Tax=Herbidospora sakaeratensis TaxID=564415 RepID=UPI000AEB0BF2
MRLDIDGWLLLSAVIVLAAVVSVRVAHRTGLPSLLLYLALGVALGESGLGIHFEDAELAKQIGLIALAIILAEGGLTTNWEHVRKAVPTAMVLATLGVAISIIVLALAVFGFLGMDWRMAMLLGAILASTDAAAVFSVLRRLPLPPRLAGTLEAESGFNDAPTVIVVVMLSQVSAPMPSGWNVLGTALWELAAGAAVGCAVGPISAYALRRVALPASGLYPIAVLAVSFIAYSGAVLLHASGFLSVYLAALIIGNSQLPHRAATRGFAEGAAWLAQIGLFVILGLLVSPGELPGQIIPGLVAGLALVLLARPISVVLSSFAVRVTRVDRVSWREQVFLSWAGLRGAVPIVLATIPWAAGVPGAKELFNEVFVIVVVFTLIQGPTLPFLARVLGLSNDGEARDLDVEAAPLEELNADLLQVRIPPASKLHGVEVFELRLPSDAAVTMVVRDGHSFVPDASTRLRRDDQLLVVTTAAQRRTVEKRLRAVSRRGKLAGWYGETGD